VDILNGRIEVGMEVVVIGGQTVGCEIAEFLVMKGIKVTMMVRSSFATKMNPTMGGRILNRLAKWGVTMLAGVTYERFENNSLVIITKEGEHKTIHADTIVIAAGARPNNRLAQALRGHVPEIYSVGDCVEPRNLMEAITEGFNTGRTI
jgi:pyruvate/2-oxoglutarate dehydrogenase complex dihydrolipoamide dehydrogenase (E3) component